VHAAARACARIPASFPGSRAELKELSDNALLAKVRALPRTTSCAAAACEIPWTATEAGPLLRQAVRGSPEPTEDLMQVGYVGLLKAINNYNPEVGDQPVRLRAALYQRRDQAPLP